MIKILKFFFSSRQRTANIRYAAGLLFFLAVYGVYAQNSGPDQRIFSPFVSQLTAETRNNLVRLSWIDSRDARGPVYIYRSLRPMDSTSLSVIRPVVIPYGTQYYVDETEGEAVSYYFAAASDVNGQRYDIFIPFTNTVVAGSSALSWPDNTAGRPYTPPSLSETRPNAADISGLNAYADGERAIISFTTGTDMKNVVLYRNTQPIRRIQDLLSAVIIKSGNSSPIIDYPAPGFAYYYALLFEDDISRGTVDVRPGKNATVYPVEIAGKAQLAPEIRSMPLPAMTVQKTAVDGNYIQIPNPVPAPAPKAADNTQQSKPEAPPLKRPRVFARDLETPSGGEESILRTIVQGPITRRDWQEARNQLMQYLSLPRSAATEARARFYLGQSYYFTGQNREALIEFLFVQDRYPGEAAEWIEAVLPALGR